MEVETLCRDEKRTKLEESPSVVEKRKKYPLVKKAGVVDDRDWPPKKIVASDKYVVWMTASGVWACRESTFDPTDPPKDVFALNSRSPSDVDVHEHVALVCDADGVAVFDCDARRRLTILDVFKTGNTWNFGEYDRVARCAIKGSVVAFEKLSKNGTYLTRFFFKSDCRWDTNGEIVNFDYPIEIATFHRENAHSYRVAFDDVEGNKMEAVMGRDPPVSRRIDSIDPLRPIEAPNGRVFRGYECVEDVKWFFPEIQVVLGSCTFYRFYAFEHTVLDEYAQEQLFDGKLALLSHFTRIKTADTLSEKARSAFPYKKGKRGRHQSLDRFETALHKETRGFRIDKSWTSSADKMVLKQFFHSTEPGMELGFLRVFDFRDVDTRRRIDEFVRPLVEIDGKYDWDERTPEENVAAFSGRVRNFVHPFPEFRFATATRKERRVFIDDTIDRVAEIYASERPYAIDRPGARAEFRSRAEYAALVVFGAPRAPWRDSKKTFKERLRSATEYVCELYEGSKDAGMVVLVLVDALVDFVLEETKSFKDHRELRAGEMGSA